MQDRLGPAGWTQRGLGYLVACPRLGPNEIHMKSIDLVSLALPMSYSGPNRCALRSFLRPALKGVRGDRKIRLVFG